MMARRDVDVLGRGLVIVVGHGGERTRKRGTGEPRERCGRAVCCREDCRLSAYETQRRDCARSGRRVRERRRGMRPELKDLAAHLDRLRVEATARMRQKRESAAGRRCRFRARILN